MFKFNLFPFFAIPDSSTGPVADLSKNDIFNMLGDDDEKEEVIDLKEPKEEKEVKEEKEDEEELETKEEKEELETKEDETDEDEEEIPEEKLELIAPVRRKEILAKYPNLFKEFPYLNNAYYREQAFTEVFPTPEDAKEAAEKAQSLDAFEDDLVKGNIKRVLESVSKTDKNAFYNIVDNFLEQLGEIDSNAKTHVIGNVIKTAVQAMALDARETNNEDLKKAAAELHKFVFGNVKFTPPEKLSKESPKEDDKDNEVRKERAAFLKEKFDHAQSTLNTRIDKVLRATVEGNIDPKDSMTSFVKKHATKEAIDAVVEQIKSDTRFIKTLDKLWEAALKDKFSEASVGKIKDAYLSKAKTLLPGAIKKARAEALKGLGGKKSREVEEVEEPEEKEDAEIRTRHPQKKTQQPRENKDRKPDGMTTREFLMSGD